MSEKAPDNYTPEYCTSIQERMKLAIESAVDALTMANQAQRDLTKQTIKGLQGAFDGVKENLKAKDREIEDLKKKIAGLRLQFYAGGISALIFLFGFTFSIIKLINSMNKPG